MNNKLKLTVFTLLCGLMLSFALTSFAMQADSSSVTENGPYEIGLRIMHLSDLNRDNRALDAYIWYPALVSKDAPRPYPPDASGAPYPLIIYSHGNAGSPTENVSLFVNHLVSQGFVVAGVNHQDSEAVKHDAESLINRPLDVLFLLNQLADLKDDPLTGLVDTENVGVTGYSLGAYASLAVGGARVDGSHFADWCTTYSNEALADYCGWMDVWDKIVAYRDQVIPSSTDDLWSATTDKRIHAILPMAPCFGQLFGERGLAEVTIPTLIIAAGADKLCPTDIDANYLYEYLGSSDRYLVTANKQGHATLHEQEGNLIKAYTSAFFGLYLQGKTDNARYLTPDSANAFKDVTLEAQVEAS